MRKINYLFATLLSMSAFTAQAALIDTKPLDTNLTVTFSGSNSMSHGAGTINVNGMNVTGTYSWGEYVAGAYMFGDNGWNTDYMVATGNMDNGYTLTFELGGLYGWAGGLFNYEPITGIRPLLQALAIDGTTVLESYDLSSAGPISGSGFSFRGIHRAEDDIAFIRISGAGIGAHEIVAGDAADVPEPATIALLASGLLGFGYIRRKSTKA